MVCDGDQLGPYAHKYPYITIGQNCIDFALSSKESNEPIFEPKFWRYVGFGYLQNQIPNVVVQNRK